jgi:organic hydroperoxide reductase OsmC/OhrA
MAARDHRYVVRTEWTGNNGTGTSSYRSYERAHELTADGKPAIAGSSDPAFRGDAARWNPEDLLVASLSSCHMLSFLHRAAVAGVVVLAYDDEAAGIMRETDDGGGSFVEVVLRPRVAVSTPEMAARCDSLHEQAHAACFIATSVAFPVRHEPTTIVATPSPAG